MKSRKDKQPATDERTPVIVYLRKSHSSDDEQEQSIPRQRSECQAYCERKGYRILAEYVDQASGSKDQEKRTGFQNMLKAIANGTEAKAVVCWNRARFGRLDAYDAAEGIRILRSNGLHLDTVREGEFNFAESSGRWKDYALSEAAKLYAETLSADSLSGRIDALRQGYWPNGAVPYGYDRCYVIGDAKTVIPRSKPAARPKGSKLKLATNEAEAKIVREVFSEFAKADVSLLSIANSLNGRKIPAPDTIQKKTQRTKTGNEGWNSDTIKAILKNVAYLGVGSIGQQRKRNSTAFNRAEALQVPNVCPVIVDKDTFAAVQAKLKKRSEDRRNCQPAKAGVLSGFVFCGHCRFRMGKRDQKGIRYICSSPGKRPHLGCKQWSIREDVLLPMVTAALVKNVDIELLARADARPTAEKVSDRAILDTQAEKLRERISNAEERYLAAPKELLSGLAAKLLAMKEELAELERRLALEDAMSSEGALAGFGKWWGEMKAKLSGGELVNVTMPEVKKVGERNVLQPGILATKEGFRNLLDTLGVKVWVFWDTDGEHYFPPVKDVQLEVDAKYTSPDHNRTTTATSNTVWPSVKGN